MEPNLNLTEPLFEKAVDYGKTSLELIRLKSLDKVADVSSTLFSRTLLVIAASFFLLLINIAVALWVGELLGKSYYGFFIVAGFYALTAIILMLIHPTIKKGMANSIISQLFN